MDIRKTAASFIPPILFDLKNKFLKKSSVSDDPPISFGKEYNSWKEALANSNGYDADNILLETRNSLLKVKAGEFAFERDTILFDKIQYSWHILAVLLRFAIENDNSLNIIDFGGSLGSSYFQNREFLKNLRDFKWNIVEQRKYSECGKIYFEDKFLKFYDDLQTCMAENHSKIILASGVLQYLEQPGEILKQFLDFNFEYIIIDRTGFSNEESDIITVQNISESIYGGSYPVWFFSLPRFIDIFKFRYKLIADIDSNIDPPYKVNGRYFFWKGLIFKRIADHV